MLTTHALRPRLSSYSWVMGMPLKPALGRSHWPLRQPKPGSRLGVPRTQAKTEIGMVSPEPDPGTRGRWSHQGELAVPHDGADRPSSGEWSVPRSYVDPEFSRSAALIDRVALQVSESLGGA